MGPSLLPIRFPGPPGAVLHSWPGRGGGLGAPGSAVPGASEEVACLWERCFRDACGVWVLLGWKLDGVEVQAPGPLCREQERC